MSEVDIKLYNFEEFNQLLEKVKAAYKDPREFAGAIQRWFLDEQKKVWASKGGRIGKSWAPNTKKWSALKARYGYSTEPNILTGATKAALTYGVGTIGTYKTGGTFLTIGLGAYKRPMRRKRIRFYNRKHRTFHPFYFMDALRPVQTSVPKGAQWQSLNALLQKLVDAKDARL